VEDDTFLDVALLPEAYGGVDRDIYQESLELPLVNIPSEDDGPSY